ncbi:MAG: hypothetical protein Q7J51_11305 [Sheuella sp.]|nr:hypothetical protein [Sheuella sp.]
MLNVEALNIFLSRRLIGQLFRFDNGTTNPIIRFVAEDHFAADTQQAILSLSMLARNPE